MTEPQARSWAYTVAAAGVIASARGVLTLAGLLPGVSVVAVGAVLAATVWLLAIGGLAPGRALVPSRAVLPIPETAASAHRRET
jgi:hypothetical protein